MEVPQSEAQERARRMLSKIEDATAYEHNALKVWECIFTAEERTLWNDEFGCAYRNGNRTVGMWAQAYGVSLDMATVEVGEALAMVTQHQSAWLVETLQLDQQCPHRIDALVEAGHLVLTQEPRCVFWRGKRYEVPPTQDAPWKYLRELAWKGKHGAALCGTDLKDNAHAGHLTNLKHRLSKDFDLPPDLMDLIESAGRRDQRLNLSRGQIYLFDENMKEINNRNPLRP